MSDEREKGSFWTTVPGILTGCAALITAIGGLVTVLITVGVIGGQGSPTAQPLPSDTPLPLPSDTPLPLPSVTPPSEGPIQSYETYVSDDLEGKSPDFQTLVVRYDDSLARITIGMVGIDDLAGEMIYMYGTYHDEIKLDSSGSFRLLRDYGADGHFEELIYSGSPERVTGSSIGIDIPLEYLPDISEKRIWGYSMQSKDRIPDEGDLRFQNSSPQ